jgi:hypothetical protein
MEKDPRVESGVHHVARRWVRVVPSLFLLVALHVDFFFSSDSFAWRFLKLKYRQK